MIARADIVRLKVTLDDVEPLVMRRIVVRIGIRLDRLHAVIQAAMGWTNSHLWEFRAGGSGWGIPDHEWPDGPLDARKATLAGVLEDASSRSLKYLYDFGDGWEHTVKVERVFEGTAGIETPFLLEAIGRCPPEDVGGPTGYAEFLEGIRDPAHEEHDAMLTWVGGEFDPAVVNVAAIEAALDKLAKRWSPRPKTVKRKNS